MNRIPIFTPFGCLPDVFLHSRSWLHNRTYVPDNIAKVVYFYGILNGNNEDWQIVYRRYGYEWRSDERAILLNALAASRDPSVLSK